MTQRSSRISAKIRAAKSNKREVSQSAQPRQTASSSPDKIGKPKLLSGGNPQIAKGYGHAVVQAYIKAMPGWKSDIGRRLDAIIERTVPGVCKAVKWNSPLYGISAHASDNSGGDAGWFLGIHCFTKYVKVAFFRGCSLRPIPPGQSTQKEVRYLDIHEHDQLDEAQFTDWVKQASNLPGVRM